MKSSSIIGQNELLSPNSTAQLVISGPVTSHKAGTVVVHDRVLCNSCSQETDLVVPALCWMLGTEIKMHFKLPPSTSPTANNFTNHTNRSQTPSDGAPPHAHLSCIPTPQPASYPTWTLDSNHSRLSSRSPAPFFLNPMGSSPGFA